jgi:hypothetical protein
MPKFRISSVVNADAKYKNVYSTGFFDASELNYLVTASSKGDALYETSSNGTYYNSWYSDVSSYPCITAPFFTRGGINNSGVNAGAFMFLLSYGELENVNTFRPVLAVATGL